MHFYCQSKLFILASDAGENFLISTLDPLLSKSSFSFPCAAAIHQMDLYSTLLVSPTTESTSQHLSTHTDTDTNTHTHLCSGDRGYHARCHLLIWNNNRLHTHSHIDSTAAGAILGTVACPRTLRHVYCTVWESPTSEHRGYSQASVSASAPIVRNCCCKSNKMRSNCGIIRLVLPSVLLVSLPPHGQKSPSAALNEWQMIKVGG